MTHYLNYETRRDMIVTHAWERWTKNGLWMNEEAREETAKIVKDTVNNYYHDDITDAQWLAATLDSLTSA